MHGAPLSRRVSQPGSANQGVVACGGSVDDGAMAMLETILATVSALGGAGLGAAGALLVPYQATFALS